MLKKEKTLESLGYSIASLTKGSKKKVIIECDYCNQDYSTEYRAYLKGRKVVEKDACKQCKYKKREDMSMAKHGVKNSAQRLDVRKKISDKAEGFDERRLETIKKKYGTPNVMQNKQIRQKYQESLRDRYGVENISQIESVKEKAKETNLRKFGHEYFLGSAEGRRRSAEAIKKKYGVNNVFQADSVKKKIVQSNLKKFNVEYPMQSEEILEKSHQTNLKKYGCENVAQSQEIKDKIKETNLKRYGVASVLQSKEIQKKIIETNLEKYGHKVPTQNPAIVKKILDTKIKKGIIQIVDKKTMFEWAEELNKPYSTFIAQIAKHGFDKAVQLDGKDNALEQMIKIWLDEIGIGYTRHLQVNGRYTDFIIPSHKIIIETDGLYWHSDLFLNNDYHDQKRKDYIDAGYTPLFFREDEVYNKLEIVQSIILNKIGKSDRIFARKCRITTLPKKQSNIFFENNHLMGKGRGCTYALEYNGEIVSAMSFRRVEGDNWEISRFCHKLNTQVVGAFSRLIKHFINNTKVDNLMTFVDLRYGSGDYLEQLGFKHTSTNLSFNWTDFQRTFHRMKFKSNSGYDYGLCKIWDCGQARYDKLF